MLVALITFSVLFGLVRIFERKRDDLDGFDIGMVALVPVLVVVIVQVVISFFFSDPLLMRVLPPLALIGFTFVLLFRHLEIPIIRSIAYTLAVVTVNTVMAIMLVY
jgi:hypothetical protein